MGAAYFVRCFAAAVLLLCASVGAWAGASCECPKGDTLQTPAPSYAELKLTTERLKSLDKLRRELQEDISLKTDAARNSRFSSCFNGKFADVAKFVQIKDITDVSYSAYVPYMESFFLRRDYSGEDVVAVAQDLAVYKELEWQRKTNPYAPAQIKPKIVGVRPCEWSKLTDHKDDGVGSIGGYFDEQKNIVYYNSCSSLKDTVTIVIHELTHAATRTKELDDMHGAFRSIGGRVGELLSKGAEGALIDKNRLRYSEEYRAYLRGAKADRELLATYPGLDAGASSAACGDTAAWVDFWQKFEDINGAGGYPKTLSADELARLRRDANCPTASK